MSFYTIETPGNRAEEVKKYLQLREYLRAKDSIDKTGYYTKKKELSKMFKPISKPLEKLQAEVKTLPQEIGKATGEEFGKVLQTLPNLPMLQQPAEFADVGGLPYAGLPPEIEGEKVKVLDMSTGDRFVDLKLSERTQNNKNKDFFNFDYNQGSYVIGGDPITIKTDGIKFKDKTYDYRFELVDLITSENDVSTSKNNLKAVEDYKDILKNSNIMHQITKDGRLTPNEKLKKLPKWEQLNLKKDYLNERPNLLIKYKDEIEAKKKQAGKGIKQTNKNKTVFLSSDPNALADRLALLCASLKAGNTGLNNEVVDICNELIRMGAMTRQQKNKILKHFKPY